MLGGSRMLSLQQGSITFIDKEYMNMEDMSKIYMLHDAVVLLKLYTSCMMQ